MLTLNPVGVHGYAIKWYTHVSIIQFPRAFLPGGFNMFQIWFAEMEW